MLEFGMGDGMVKVVLNPSFNRAFHAAILERAHKAELVIPLSMTCCCLPCADSRRHVLTDHDGSQMGIRPHHLGDDRRIDHA